MCRRLSIAEVSRCRYVCLRIQSPSRRSFKDAVLSLRSSALDRAVETADLIEAGEGADLLNRLVPDADGDALLAYLAVGR